MVAGPSVRSSSKRLCCDPLWSYVMQSGSQWVCCVGRLVCCEAEEVVTVWVCCVQIISPALFLLPCYCSAFILLFVSIQWLYIRKLDMLVLCHLFFVIFCAFIHSILELVGIVGD